MTNVKINPGICGLLTTVEAVSVDDNYEEVKIKVKSSCESINKMLEELGDTYDPFEICLTKPGDNDFYRYASKNFPGHGACPVISGIIKCAEVECKLALPAEATITFL